MYTDRRSTRCPADHQQAQLGARAHHRVLLRRRLNTVLVRWRGGVVAEIRGDLDRREPRRVLDGRGAFLLLLGLDGLEDVPLACPTLDSEVKLLAMARKGTTKRQEEGPLCEGHVGRREKGAYHGPECCEHRTHEQPDAGDAQLDFLCEHPFPPPSRSHCAANSARRFWLRDRNAAFNSGLCSFRCRLQLARNTNRPTQIDRSDCPHAWVFTRAPQFS